MKKYALTVAVAIMSLSCGRNDFRAGWVSTDFRYDSCPEQFSDNAFTYPVWRGDKAIAEFLVCKDGGSACLDAVAGDLKCGTAVIPADCVSIGAVRYVKSDTYAKYLGTAEEKKAAREKNDSVSVADVIDLTAGAETVPGRVQPFWVSVKVPSDAVPGIYKGVVRVMEGDRTAGKLKFTLEVTDRTLPPFNDWKFHLDLWQNPYSVAVAEGVELWSDAHFKALKTVMEPLAAAGQKVITATLTDRPWNGQTYVPFGSMVGKTLGKDGKWSYDYTVFDKWVEFMMSLGIDGQIHCYTMISWGMNFDYFDEKTGENVSFTAMAPSKKYDWYWSSLLADFSRHLDAKGWLDRTYISMDERGEDVMRAAIGLIHKVAPGLKVSLAGRYKDFYMDNVDDFCTVYYDLLDDSVMEGRRQRGKITTFYTCCRPIFPNTFTISVPAEAAWLGWYAASQGFDGYLRWAYNSWNENPMEDTRYKSGSWTGGDCFLVYPGGRSSIRFEKLCEGIRFYEKIRILREGASEETLKAIDEILAPINIGNCPPSEQKPVDGILAEAAARLSRL